MAGLKKYWGLALIALIVGAIWFLSSFKNEEQEAINRGKELDAKFKEINRGNSYQIK